MRPIRFLNDFIKSESLGGFVLFFAALIAFTFANSPLSEAYEHFVEFDLGFELGQFQFTKPLVHWVNDGLMTLFFLLVGLEIKREIFEGELNSASKVALPAIAAIGGMLAPAFIYLAFNWGNLQAMRGFGIPVATDIAFSLGVISLLTSRVPISLKVFLTALAIFDDIGAIAIIALFYTAQISFVALLGAAICTLILFSLNHLRVLKLYPYVLVGGLLWLMVLKSGVHSTLAGVIIGFALPLSRPAGSPISPLQRLEHMLQPWVAYAILPIFAFMNAGVALRDIGINDLFSPIVLGIVLGLFIGKQGGIFLATFAAVKLGLAPMPRNATWLGVYGISIVCGIGFTMSLFVGSLAFSGLDSQYTTWVRMSVLLGSGLSALVGYCALRFLPVINNN